MYGLYVVYSDHGLRRRDYGNRNGPVDSEEKYGCDGSDERTEGNLFV